MIYHPPPVNTIYRCPSVGILCVTGEHMNDEVYKLHILRAMSRPCYIMACYITVQERSSIRAAYSRNSSSIIKRETSKFSFGTSSSLSSKHESIDPQDPDFQADPNCFVHYECNDPILRSFSLMNAAKEMSHNSPEYKEEYQEIVQNAEQFSTEILSKCRNSTEVEMLLSEQVGASHVLRKVSKITFPRLRMAVETGQKEFVGHIYSQQVLSQQWIGTTNWDKKSNLSKAMHALMKIIFTPIFCIAYITKTVMKTYKKDQGLPKFFDDLYLFNSLDAPINRCISHTTTLAIILFLIMDAVLHPISDECISLTNDKIYTMKKSKIALILMIVACVFKEIEDFFSVRSFKIYLKFDFWRIYRSINHWIIIIALTIQIHLELRLSADPSLEFEAEARLANSMFALAATISMMHSLYWLQLHPKMGPIVISVSKIVMDVITISSMYVIVLISFSSGIMFILGTEKITDLKCRRTLNSTVETIENDLSDFTETFETMFWSWLGPGQEFKTSDSPDHPDLVSSRGVFAIVLMGIYQTISAVIIMNLLVAIMNSTIQNVQDKKLLYWKFVRAGFWIRFFDENRALPPPYNLLHIFGYVYSFVKTKCFASKNLQSNEIKYSSTETEKHFQHRELMFDLLQRYTEQSLEIKREKVEERGHGTSNNNLTNISMECVHD